MSVFVDTNILLRSVQPSHPHHERAVGSVAGLLASATPLVVTPQVMAEFWSVATRPLGHNGLGMPHVAVREELARLEGFFAVVSETAEVYAAWKDLVLRHAVTGVNVHDARLVAAMSVHGIKRILTFNRQDFERYVGIEIITPA